MNTHAVFAEKVLAVTPSTVLDAHIGYTRKCSGVTGSLKSNPDYRCSRCKGTARPIDGDLIMNGFLCKIKNWMLLIHSATLEIRLVLGVVAI